MAEVKIEITAQDGTQQAFKAMEQSGKSAFDKVSQSAADSTSKISSVFEQCKAHWITVTAAMYAAWRTVEKAIDFVKLGAQALQAEESFKSVATAYGEDADKMLHKMKEVSAGMIDDSALMQRAVKGLQQGLSGEQIVSLLEVARSSARVAGIDIESAFDRITDATANQMTRGLKSLGIVIDQNKAFEVHARKIGVSKDALTELQQSQALANAAIEEGRRQMKAMGDVVENAAEKLQKAEKQLHEMKETIGKGLLSALLGAAGAMYWLAAGALSAAGYVMKLGAAILSLSPFEKFRQEGKDLSQESKSIFEGAGELTGKAMTLWGAAGDFLSGRAKEVSEKLKGMAAEQQEAADKARALEDAQKKQAQGIMASIDALGKYSSVIKSIDTDALAFAGEKFNETLKKQSEIIERMTKQSDVDFGLGKYYAAVREITSINISRTPLDELLNKINEAGHRQLSLQRGIKAQLETEKSAMESLMKSNAKLASELPSAAQHMTGQIIQQDIRTLETHKEMLTHRLDAERSYYAEADALRKKAYDEQIQKTMQLVQLEQQIRQSQMTADDAILTIKQRTMTASEKYYSSVERLEEKYRMTQNLSGQEKINILNQVISAWTSLAGEVKEGDKVVVSAADSQKRAMWGVEQAARAVRYEQEEQKTALQSQKSAWEEVEKSAIQAMAKAKEMMELYQGQIKDLSNQIVGLNKSFELYVDSSQPKQAINEIKGAFERLKAYIESNPIKAVVHHTGTGSTEKPIMDKIAEITSAYGNLPTGGKFNVDFTQLTGAISLYTSLLEKQQHYKDLYNLAGSMGQINMGAAAAGRTYDEPLQMIRSMMGSMRGDTSAPVVPITSAGMLPSASGGQTDQRSYNFGDINVTNMSSQNADALARDLVPKIKRYMGRYM